MQMVLGVAIASTNELWKLWNGMDECILIVPLLGNILSVIFATFIYEPSC